MICDFTYYSPTKVVFGKGRERETGVLVKERGAQKVLILYGGKSAQKSGLLFRVTDSLEQAGIAYAALGGVTPNPRLSFVRMGTQKAREEGIDLILAAHRAQLEERKTGMHRQHHDGTQQNKQGIRAGNQCCHCIVYIHHN